MKTWIGILLIVILGGGYWWWQSTQAPTLEGAPQGTVSQMPVLGSSTEEMIVGDSMMSATVTYDGSAFSPAKVTIKKGGSVTWENVGETTMWVASAQHPTHTVYAGTDLQTHCATSANDSFDQCAAGDTYSFTFDNVGTWNYHDHLHASVFGSVEVVE